MTRREEECETIKVSSEENLKEEKCGKTQKLVNEFVVERIEEALVLEASDLQWTRKVEVVKEEREENENDFFCSIYWCDSTMKNQNHQPTLVFFNCHPFSFYLFIYLLYCYLLVG